MAKNCAKRRFGRQLARRNIPSRKLSAWCLHVDVYKGHQIEGQGDFFDSIIFGAAHGGSAKVKAVPKLQNIVARMNEYLNCDEKLRISAILGRISKVGKEAPTYELRHERTFYKGMVTEHRPSKFFRVIQNGRNGGNGH